MPIVADTPMHAIAIALGIKFEGLQIPKDGPALEQFSDPETGGTFWVEPGRSISDALYKMRAKFNDARARERQRAGVA